MCDVAPWFWLSDLCDETKTDLGDVLNQFGDSMSWHFNELSKTKAGKQALASNDPKVLRQARRGDE